MQNAASREDRLAELRRRIRAMEGLPAGLRADSLPLGLDAVDGVLPGGGLARGAVHEVTAAQPGSGTGFAALLAGRAAAEGPVFWIAPRAEVYPPGLAAFSPGLGEDWTRHLVLVRARRRDDLLWTFEEILRERGPALVVAEARADAVDLAASRRLQLAAEAGGGLGLLLRSSIGPGESALPPLAAASRWRLAAAPSRSADSWGGLGPARWRLSLLRCRGGRPGDWTVEWDHEARRLHLAAGLRDRPDRPARLPLAG